MTGTTIGADNGIFWLLFDGPQEAFELTMKLDTDNLTFPRARRSCWRPATSRAAHPMHRPQDGVRNIPASSLANTIRAVPGRLRQRGSPTSAATCSRRSDAAGPSIQPHRHDIKTLAKTYGDVNPGDRVGLLWIQRVPGGGGEQGRGRLRAEVPPGCSDWPQDPVRVEFDERSRPPHASSAWYAWPSDPVKGAS